MNGVVILVVEDDTFQRMALVEELAAAGFECVDAGTGKEALKEVATGVARFQAVVTDIRLGAGPNGWDVARAAREQVPDIPIVYVSGDSGQDWSAWGVPQSVMIGKPYVCAQVITAITTLINARTIGPSAGD